MCGDSIPGVIEFSIFAGKFMVDEKNSNKEDSSEDLVGKDDENLESPSEESEDDQSFTSKNVHPLFKTRAGTDEDSLPLPDLVDEVDEVDENSEAEETSEELIASHESRRVAKTMLEADLPDLEKLKEKVEAASLKEEEEKPQPQRKVAKTMLESDLPDLGKLREAVVEASQIEEEQEGSEEVLQEVEEREEAGEEKKSDSHAASDRQAARTTMESDLPKLDQLRERIDEVEQSTSCDQTRANLNIAKTMLESDFPDLLRIQALIETKESQSDQRKSGSHFKTVAMPKPAQDGKVKGGPRASYSRIQQALMKGAPNTVQISLRLTQELSKKSLSRSFSSLNEASTKKEILVEGADSVTRPSFVGLDFRPIESSIDFNNLQAPDAFPEIKSDQFQDDGSPASSIPETKFPEPVKELVLEPSIPETKFREFASPEEADSKDLNLVEPETSLAAPDNTVEIQSEKSPSNEEESKSFQEIESVVQEDVKSPQFDEASSTSKREQYANAAKREEHVARTMLDHELILDQLGDSISRIEQKQMEEIKEKEKEQEEKELTDPISNFKTAKSCPWTWEDTGAHDKFRFCGECDNLIYDFKGMTNTEAEALIFQRENKSKYTLLKRADGKFMTANCPHGAKKMRFVAFVTLVVVGLVSLVVAVSAFIASQPKPQPVQAPAVDSSGQTSSSNAVTPADTSSAPSTPSTPQVPSAVPKVNPDGSMYYDAGSGSQSSPVPAQTNNAPEPAPEPDYSNVPEADQSGKQWKFDD